MVFGHSTRHTIVAMSQKMMVGTSFDALRPQVSSAHQFMSSCVIVFAQKKILMKKLSSENFGLEKLKEISQFFVDFGCSSNPRFVTMCPKMMVGTSFDALRSHLSSAHRFMCLFCLVFAKQCFSEKLTSYKRLEMIMFICFLQTAAFSLIKSHALELKF